MPHNTEREKEKQNAKPSAPHRPWCKDRAGATHLGVEHIRRQHPGFISEVEASCGIDKVRCTYGLEGATERRR